MKPFSDLFTAVKQIKAEQLEVSKAKEREYVHSLIINKFDKTVGPSIRVDLYKIPEFIQNELREAGFTVEVGTKTVLISID